MKAKRTTKLSKAARERKIRMLDVKLTCLVLPRTVEADGAATIAQNYEWYLPICLWTYGEAKQSKGAILRGFCTGLSAASPSNIDAAILHASEGVTI